MTIDSRIKATILQSYALEPSLEDSRIHVHVRALRVTILGEVGSEAERATAERLARNAEAVQSVRSRLQVYPNRTHAEDAQIDAAARHALRWALAESAAGIQITVKHGWLTLEGEVAADDCRRAAESAIVNLWGLRGVTMRITVSQTTASWGSFSPLQSLRLS